MVKHTFKIIWNARKRFVGIFVEQLLVFIVLMLCLVSVYESINQYMQPGLPDTEDVVSFGYMYREGMDDAAKERLAQNMDAILGMLQQNDNVISVNESANLTPYMRSDENYSSDSITIDNQRLFVNMKLSGENGLDVFKYELVEGEWIPAQWEGPLPMVVTKDLVDNIGWESAIGKKVTIEYFGESIVVGVVAGVRNDAFVERHPTIILPVSIYNPRYSFYRELCARVKPGYKNEFSTLFFKEFNRLISEPNIEPLIQDMGVMKKTAMFETITSITFKIIPSIFLLIFAFIGTFGLFWLYSQKRTSEFALRMALGSTRVQLTRMVILESLIITVAATIPGLMLALFIYEFTAVTCLAVFATFIIMILFSVISAWYPAYRVSRIEPAHALHYE